jgi:hypothetical protein
VATAAQASRRFRWNGTQTPLFEANHHRFRLYFLTPRSQGRDVDMPLGLTSRDCFGNSFVKYKNKKQAARS